MEPTDNIIPGKILWLNVCFPHEMQFHDKYFVLCSYEFPLLLKINTSKTQSKIAQKKKEYLFSLKKSTYTFLTYDSYLDCGTVWSNLISMEEIISQVTKFPSRIKGEVTSDHRNEIIRLTGKSKSIAARHKKLIANALR